MSWNTLNNIFRNMFVRDSARPLNWAYKGKEFPKILYNLSKNLFYTNQMAILHPIYEIPSGLLSERWNIFLFFFSNQFCSVGQVVQNQCDCLHYSWKDFSPRENDSYKGTSSSIISLPLSFLILRAI